ncbi:cyclophilin-like fold protein [Streptomyces sp. NPDC096310]|uniref:cyclophilin-like fold protein n=1 Tax=Streptomyces sp. NPDC096310 TaxID=3366082 RepID=UPI003814F146
MIPAALPALARAVTAAALLMAVTACTEDSTPSPAPSSSSASSLPAGTPERPATGPAPTTPSGRSSALKIRITIDGTPVDTTLNNSDAARDFAAQLPLTLNLTDFHQNEKIADLPRRLSTSGAPSGVHPRTGDLAYYAPWGNLAIYYRDGSPSAGNDLIILGHLPESATARLAGDDEVGVTIDNVP